MSHLMRVSIEGTMPGGEVWSVNPCFRLGSGLGTPVTDSQMSATLTALQGLSIPSGLTSFFSTNTTITGYRLEARLLDGTLQNLAEGARSTPQGGTGTGNLPYQAAAVSSLRTGTFGAKGRGRLYWPATGAVLQSSNLRPSSANVTTFLGGVKVFLQDIESAIDANVTGSTLAVWSRTSSSIDNVNLIQVGDIIDTQRRRRDALVESYSAIAYP